MMNNGHRSEVRILFGDSAQKSRGLYRQAMIGAGYSNLREFDTLENFIDLVAVAQPDLILMDIGLPGGNVAQLVSDMRHGKLGINPYLPVILTTWEAEQSVVRRLMDAGADDLLIKPISTKGLLDRLEAVGLNRKPFVVTSDYIGPDRRRAEARRESNVPLFEVPNPMRAKLTGEAIDARAFQQAIMLMNEQINQQRLRASAFRIAFVTAQIVPLYKAQTMPDANTLTMLRDLIASVEDIKQRIAGTELAHVGQICDRLLEPAKQIYARGEDFVFTMDWQKSFDLLKSLGDAVLALFNPGSDASALASEVAVAIDRFRARRAAQAAGQVPAS
jgi:DNA-binding response OmpR family regulator